MGYEIPVALITGGSGYVAGLVTPWAKWKIQKRRFERDSRVGLIKQWRVENRQLRLAETQVKSRGVTKRTQNRAYQSSPISSKPIRRITSGSGGYATSFQNGQPAASNNCAFCLREQPLSPTPVTVWEWSNGTDDCAVFVTPPRRGKWIEFRRGPWPNGEPCTGKVQVG